MGAYSFLCKRTPQLAGRLILSGNMHSAEDLHRMGIVDVLVPRGQGVRGRPCRSHPPAQRRRTRTRAQRRVARSRSRSATTN